MAMELRRCSESQREMELRRCSESQRERKSTTFFCVLSHGDYRHIVKLDLNAHFSPSTADLTYFGRSKATQPPLRRRYSISRCRLKHYLSITIRKRKMKSKFWKRRGPPTLPRPCFWFLAEGLAHEGELPENAALVALGSKFYLFGGILRKSRSERRRELRNETLARDVYVIDTAENRPEMVKASCLLNWGKREPIAWTIKGKIYVMPHSLDEKSDPAPGKYFECYDPESDSWTILPNPPLGEGSNPIRGNFSVIYAGKYSFDPLSVKSHAVVGSTLLISVAANHGVFAFDTTRIELGWRRILLQLLPAPVTTRTRMLNFLPFDPEFSTPIGENLVLCCPDSLAMRVREFLSKKLGIDCKKDYYVCQFDTNALHDNVGSDSDFLRVPISITPLIGTMRMRWEKFVQYFSTARRYTGFGNNGIVLFLEIGFDYDLVSNIRRMFREQPVDDKGDLYYSFEVLRVARSSDDANNQQLRPSPCIAAATASSSSEPLPKGEYEAAGVSSALFRENSLLKYAPPGVFRCFVMEDGIFIN